MPYTFCIVCFEHSWCMKCTCGGDFYCSIACQKQHWGVHKEYCPYRQAMLSLKAVTTADGVQLPKEVYTQILHFWGIPGKVIRQL